MAQVYNYAYYGNPNEFMSRVSRIPNLDRDEELALVESWKHHNNSRALDQLVASHQKLLVRMIYGAKLQNRFDEALQAGNEGLIAAINKFEPEKGFRLSTYATWWINAKFTEVYPRSMVNLITTAERKRVKIHLSRALNDVTGGHRAPQQQDFEKVAELLQVDVKDVLDIYPILSQGDMSLDAPMVTNGGEEGSERIDFLADTSPNPEDIVMQITEVDNARERLADAMKVLQGRERDIFIARRLEDPPKTLEDLAKMFNISRERIRQIDEKAFERVYDAVHGIERKAGNHRRGPRASKNVPETLDI